MSHSLTRRRFFTLTGAAAGLPLLPTVSDGAKAVEAAPGLRTWKGVALGADATLQINHPDPILADRLIDRSLAEVARLERIFSLYREDSAIVRLNAEGRLDAPPADLVRILSESQEFSRATRGAFDITVQPLWRLYADHFARDFADPNGPNPAEIRAALSLVGHDAIDVDARFIRFQRKGMQITLNGIAQGYVTDRIAELLIEAGLDRALVDMGEIRALGDRPAGGPWQIGLEDPRRPGAVAETVALRDRAVATSGGYGTPFDARGHFNHIFDPATGRTSSRYLAASVIAPTATVADALAKAFCLADPQDFGAVAAGFGVEAHLVLPDGSRRVVRPA